MQGTYCTPDHLYQFVAGLDPQNQKTPAAEFLEPVIENVTNDINAKVGDRYRVPINQNDSPKSFSILRFLAIDLCREKIAQRLDWATYNPQTGQMPAWEKAVKVAKMKLEEIREGRYPLPDAKTCDSQSCEAIEVGYYDTSEIASRTETRELDCPFPRGQSSRVQI